MKIDALYIEITNRCNLNCVDCYNASGHNTTTTEISPDTFEKIIDYFYAKFNVTSFSISGGEPFMHSKWHQIVDIMERYENLSFFVVTNGTVNDDYYVRLMEQNTRFHIQLSVDGADEKTHSLTRGLDNFSKTIYNISKIKSITKPIMKMVITKHNYYQIDEYFALAISLGCLPAISFADMQGNAIHNWDELNLSDVEKIKVIKEVEKMNIKYNIKSKPPYVTFKCTYISCGEDYNLCIKPNGNIQPCHNLYDDIFSIGSIYNLDELDLDENISIFRKSIKERLDIDYGCGGCINKEACDRGCPAAAYMKHGDILASDDDCKLRKLQTAFIPIMDYIKQRGE